MRLIETAWSIVAVLGSVLAVGLPVQWLMGGRRRLSASDWVRAPVMGLSAIVVFVLLLTFLDVPVRRSAIALWAVTVLLWIVLVRRGAIDRGAIPLPAALGAAAVFLAHGCGLLWAGSHDYVGRGWSDQLNYTAIAQFLLDEPFSRTLADVGLRPYLFLGIFHKEARIGQSVAHAFFSATAGQDAKTLFEPTILLAPVLVFLALHELCRVFTGARPTLAQVAACAGAAAVPGLATLHLEGFLSQCVSLPFLVLWPVLLRDVVATTAARSLLAACLVCAAMTATYPEMLPVLLAVAAGAVAVAAIGARDRLRLARAFGILLLPPLLLSLTPVLRGFVKAAGYVGLSTGANLYPWAFRLEGLARLWAGDLVERVATPFVPGVIAVVLTLAGYAGLGLAAASRWRRGSDSGERSTALALGTATLLLVLTPIGVLLAPGQHPYQFYKLALGVAPVVALGLTFLPTGGPRRAAVGVLLLVSPAATVEMALRAGHGVDGPRSMAAHDLMSDEVRGIGAILGDLRDRDLVLLQRDTPYRPPGVLNAWFAYLGRANRVWLGNSMLNQHFGFERHWSLARARDLGRVPADAVFLTSRRDPWSAIPPGARVLWKGPAYRIWTPSQPGPWATLVWADNPNGLEEVEDKPFLWLGGGETRLLILAGEAGTARFSAQCWIGPAGGTTRHVRVRSSTGWDQTIALTGGPGAFSVPLSPGIQEVRLLALEHEASASPKDARPLVLGLLDLQMEFTPEP